MLYWVSKFRPYEYNTVINFVIKSSRRFDIIYTYQISCLLQEKKLLILIKNLYKYIQQKCRKLSINNSLDELNLQVSKTTKS